MATDATGTPTTLGIPKFNTSVDAPSGLGTNAMMDALDTLIAARIAKPSTPASGDALVWNGTTWEKSSGATKVAVAGLAPGTNGQFLQTSGGAPVWAAGPSGTTVYRKVTEKEVINTVTETDLLNSEITVGAGVMGATGILRVHLFGDMLSNATGTVTVRLKFGGTTLWGDAYAITNSTTRMPWHLDFRLVNRNATNSQWLGGIMQAGPGSAGAAGSVAGLGDVGLKVDTVYSTIGSSAAHALDTTGALALVFTAQWDAASVNSAMRLQGGIIEVI